MLEKLPVSGVRKLFAFLTNGNAEIKFHTICLQNRDRERAANRPIVFGMQLLFCNVLYRLPVLRDWPFHRRLGHDYITQQYLRLPVEDLSSEILENPAAVCDGTGSLWLPVHGTGAFFAKLEEHFGVKGFASTRALYDDPLTPLSVIYDRINRALGTTLSWRDELPLAEANDIPNRYIIRLLDIAAYHDVALHLVFDSSYPSCFFERRVKQLGLHPDTLSVSCESGMKKREAVGALSLSKFGIVSADFAGFVKPLTQAGGRPIYYRSPSLLMHETKQPPLSSPFREVYEAVCGAALFTGRWRAPFSYELGYLCAGPVLYAAVGENPTREDAEGALARLGETGPLLTLPGLWEQSPLALGARAFCRDYGRWGQGVPIPREDAHHLYRCGCTAMESLKGENDAGTLPLFSV